MDKGLYDKKLNPGRIYVRNQLLFGIAKENIPKSIRVNGTEVLLENEIFDIPGLVNYSLHEMIAMHMLDNIKLCPYGDDRILTLRDCLRGETQLRSESRKFLFDLLKQNPEGFMEMYPLEFKQSKGKQGIQSFLLYADFRQLAEGPLQVFQQCLQLIFGEDKLGVTLREFMSNTECPNIVDILAGSCFSRLLAAITVQRNITNLRNYFAARGMTYLNQSPFITMGLVCGYANISYVGRLLTGASLNAIQRKELQKDMLESGNRDMVLLNITFAPAAYMGSKFIYFPAGRFQKFINSYHSVFGVYESDKASNQFKLPIEPCNLSPCGGLIYNH